MSDFLKNKEIINEVIETTGLKKAFKGVKLAKDLDWSFYMVLAAFRSVTDREAKISDSIDEFVKKYDRETIVKMITVYNEKALNKWSTRAFAWSDFKDILK